MRLRFSLPDLFPLIAALVVFALFMVIGCTSLDEVSCHTEAKGAIVDRSGRLAVGSVNIQNAPRGVESAMVSYKDSMPLIGDEKEHYIQVLLTGSNSVASITGVVSNICNAFIRTAPAVVDSKE
jgi:hypothetical protein